MKYDPPISYQTPEEKERLVYPYRREIQMGSCLYRWCISAGFEYRPNIPVPFMSIVPPQKLRIPSLSHDWMYRHSGDVTKHGRLEVYQSKEWVQVKRVSRKFTDKVFVELMKERGVSKTRRKLANFAIRSYVGEYLWDDPPSDELETIKPDTYFPDDPPRRIAF